MDYRYIADIITQWDIGNGICHYELVLNSTMDFSQLHNPYIIANTIRRAIYPSDRWEYMYIPIRRYRAMRNSSKLRLSTAERLYLAELVRLELTSLN